jgi:hypothetical protein
MYGNASGVESVRQLDGGAAVKELGVAIADSLANDILVVSVYNMRMTALSL